MNTYNSFFSAKTVFSLFSGILVFAFCFGQDDVNFLKFLLWTNSNEIKTVNFKIDQYWMNLTKRIYKNTTHSINTLKTQTLHVACQIKTIFYFENESFATLKSDMSSSLKSWTRTIVSIRSKQFFSSSYSSLVGLQIRELFI